MEWLNNPKASFHWLEKGWRVSTRQVLSLALVGAMAFSLWGGLMAWTGSPSPVVVVLSGSMEPAFARGDILMLDNNAERLEIGDIVVFTVKQQEIPIIHRIIEIRVTETGRQKILTKGDNNYASDDHGIYLHGQKWVEREDVLGRARIHIPSAGMLTIVMNDYPYLKVLLLTILGFAVLTSSD